MAYDPSKSKFQVQIYGKQAVRLGRKTIIYGMTGAGKTTLASSWPSPIFLDTDFGENVALVEKGIPYFSPTKTNYFGSCLGFVTSMLKGVDVFDPEGGPFAQCRTLVIDTWTKFNQAILTEAAREGGRDLTQVKATFTDWGLLRQRQAAFMDLITQLAEYKGIDVVITAQPAVLGDEMEDAKKSDDEQGYNNVIGMPALIGGYKRAFGADVSEMYYLEVLEGATPIRRLWTRPRQSYYAKTRIGLPGSIDNPTYEKIQGLAKI